MAKYHSINLSDDDLSDEDDADSLSECRPDKYCLIFLSSRDLASRPACTYGAQNIFRPHFFYVSRAAVVYVID